MISPTIGRVVWYHPPFTPDSGSNELTHAAIITHVWSDTCVNIAIFDSNGVPYSATSVFLFQEGYSARPSSQYAEWMPYQIGQAAKTESLIAATVQPDDHAPPIGAGAPTGPPPPTNA